MSDIEPMTDEQLEGWAVARFANGMDEVPIYTDALRDFIAARDEQWRAFLADREKRAQAAQGDATLAERHRELYCATYLLLDSVCEDHPAIADVFNLDSHGRVCGALAQLDGHYGVDSPESLAQLATEASKPVQPEAPTASNEREHFESTVVLDTGDEDADFRRNDDGRYTNYYLELAWNGWQARAALATQQEAQPQAEPAGGDKEDADMFWDHDDGERFGHDIDEIIQDYGPGEIVKIDRAKRLPMITVRVLPAKDDNSYFEYEVIDDDAARAAQQATGERG